MKFIFHPLAVKDVRKIEADYSGILPELGARFWKELNEGIDEIFSHPTRHHFDGSGYRRFNLQKFPYHILFEERAAGVRIMVIRHHARSPSFGMKRR